MKKATIKRKTNETDIVCELILQAGESSVDTGIGFFDHMLLSFAKHAGITLKITCKGDLSVDGHHTVEDVGIVLGAAVNEALCDKMGITRYACCFIPMDEALAFCSMDISNRPVLVFNADFNEQKTGDFDTILTEEFMRAFATNAGITLHLKVEYGCNAHHKIEALFKALAHAFRKAIMPVNENLTTKGTI